MDEELLNDTNHRFDSWFQRAEDTLSFAETAKDKFEKGDIHTKRELLVRLGWNLTLTNNNLAISLTKPLSVVERISKELNNLHNSLEPSDVLSQADYESYCGESEVWGRLLQNLKYSLIEMEVA